MMMMTMTAMMMMHMLLQAHMNNEAISWQMAWLMMAQGRHQVFPQFPIVKKCAYVSLLMFYYGYVPNDFTRILQDYFTVDKVRLWNNIILLWNENVMKNSIEDKAFCGLRWPLSET